MPSRSRAQQRLFGMAWAVRQGKMKKKDAPKEVLDIANSKMTDQQIHDFASTKGLRNHYVRGSKYRKIANQRKKEKEKQQKNESFNSLSNFLYKLLNESLVNEMQAAFQLEPEENIKKIDDQAANTKRKITKLNRCIRYSNGYEPDLDVNALDKKVFIIVKPGFLNLSQTIIDMFVNEGFTLYQTKTKKLSINEARKLYYVHHEEDFYKDLCKYMSSDLSLGITFNYKGEWKAALKKTDKLKDKIREKYGESEMRNVMHSSDSLENMKKESSIYF